MPVLLAAFMGLTSCERSVDVYIVNPCDKPVLVENFSLPPERVQPDRGPDSSARLPVASITKIIHAFVDLSPDVATRVNGTAYVRSNVKHLTHSTLLIPAALC